MLPRTAGMLKLKYCHGDYKTCARFLCAANGVKPAEDLFPNEIDKALELLQNAGKKLPPAFSENGPESSRS